MLAYAHDLRSAFNLVGAPNYVQRPNRSPRMIGLRAALACLVSIPLAGCAGDDASMRSVIVDGALGVPISLELGSSLLFVEARINDGPPRYLVVDTGAQTVVLDDSLPEFPAAGPIDSLELGGTRFSGVGAARLDLDHLNVAAGRPVAGLLGGPFLRDFIAVVDYQQLELSLFETELDADAAIQTWAHIADTPPSVVPTTTAQGFLISEAHIAAERLLVIVDTGASTDLVFEDRIRLNDAPRLTGLRGVDPNGDTFALDLFRVCDARLGSAENHFAYHTLAPADAFESIQTLLPQADGLIGTPSLREHLVTFNFGRPEIKLYDYREPTHLPSNEFVTIGAWPVNDGSGGYVFAAVFDNTDAATQGIRAEDRVLTVNGTSSEELATLSELQAILRGEAGTQVELSVQRGQETLNLTVAREDLLPLMCN